MAIKSYNQIIEVNKKEINKLVYLLQWSRRDSGRTPDTYIIIVSKLEIK